MSRCKRLVSVASDTGGASAPHSCTEVNVHMSRSDSSDDAPVIVSGPLMSRSDVSADAFDIVSDILAPSPLPQITDVTASGGVSPQSSCMEDDVPVGRCKFQVSVASCPLQNSTGTVVEESLPVCPVKMQHWNEQIHSN